MSQELTPRLICMYVSQFLVSCYSVFKYYIGGFITHTFITIDLQIVTGNFLTCLEPYSNPGSGERQQASSQYQRHRSVYFRGMSHS